MGRAGINAFQPETEKDKSSRSTLFHLLSPSQIVGRKQSLNTAIAHCAVEYNGLCGKCRMWLGQAALRWGLRYACPSVEYARLTIQTLINARKGWAQATFPHARHEQPFGLPINQPTRPAQRDCLFARSRLSRIPTARVVSPRLQRPSGPILHLHHCGFEMSPDCLDQKNAADHDQANMDIKDERVRFHSSIDPSAKDNRRQCHRQRNQVVPGHVSHP